MSKNFKLDCFILVSIFYNQIVLKDVYIGAVKCDNAYDNACDNACDNAGNSGTYLLTLANRNDPICVTSSKVAKASTISVAVAAVIVGIITLTFANVNTA
jgi:hypothetical protein